MTENNKDRQIPRSRIKSALQCIEEIFHVKKENPNNIRENNEIKAKQNIASRNYKIPIDPNHSMMKIEKTYNDRIIAENNINTKINVDNRIENLLNNFPNRPGSRIRVKKEEVKNNNVQISSDQSIGNGNSII